MSAASLSYLYTHSCGLGVPLCIDVFLLNWPLLVCQVMVDLFPAVCLDVVVNLSLLLFAWMLCIVDKELRKRI